jgi:hypothetical protein
MGIGKETSKETGLPIDDKSASVDSGSTSKEDTPIELTRDKKLKFKFGDKVMLDREVVDLINRGAGYQQAQSQIDKLKNELDEERQKRTILEKAYRDQELEAKIDSSVNKKWSQTGKVAELDEYGEPIIPDAEPPSPIDVKAYLESIRSDILNQIQPQVAEMTQKTIEQVFGQEFQQKQKLEEDANYFSTQEKRRKTGYSMKFNDLIQLDPSATENINRVVTLESENYAISLKLPDAFRRDQVEYQDLDERQRENQEEILQTLLTLEKQNEVAKRQLNSNAILSQGINPMAGGEIRPKEKPKNKKDAEAYKQETKRLVEQRVNAWKASQGIT